MEIINYNIVKHIMKIGKKFHLFLKGLSMLVKSVGLPFLQGENALIITSNEKVRYHADNAGGAHGKDTNDK